MSTFLPFTDDDLAKLRQDRPTAYSCQNGRWLATLDERADQIHTLREAFKHEMDRVDALRAVAEAAQAAADDPQDFDYVKLRLALGKLPQNHPGTE